MFFPVVFFFYDTQDSMVISIVNFVHFTVKLLKQELNNNTIIRSLGQ